MSFLSLCFVLRICTLKLNLWPKVDPIYDNFYSKSDFFLELLSQKIFLLFIAEFDLLMFHDKTVKISEKLNKRNVFLKKNASKLPILLISAKFAFIFTMGKKRKYLIKKMIRITVFVQR